MKVFLLAMLIGTHAINLEEVKMDAARHAFLANEELIVLLTSEFNHGLDKNGYIDWDKKFSHEFAQALQAFCNTHLLEIRDERLNLINKYLNPTEREVMVSDPVFNIIRKMINTEQTLLTNMIEDYRTADLTIFKCHTGIEKDETKILDAFAKIAQDPYIVHRNAILQLIQALQLARTEKCRKDELARTEKSQEASSDAQASQSYESSDDASQEASSKN